MATINPMEPKYLLTRTDAYGRAVANADIGETPEQSAAMIREDLKSSIDTVNEMIPYLVPPGVIVAWWGSTDAIPSGWALCDGTNGTPDLRGRFINLPPYMVLGYIMKLG